MTETSRLIPLLLLNNIVFGSSEGLQYEVVFVEFMYAEDYFNTYRVVLRDKTDNSYWSGLYDQEHRDDTMKTWCTMRKGDFVEIYRVYPKAVTKIEYVEEL